MYSVKRLTVTAFAVALLALMLAAAPAHAQRFRVPGTGGTLNPYNYYDPYGQSRQAAFNITLYGRAMSQVPPYALGYNPYPQIVNTMPYYPPVGPYYGGGNIVNNPTAAGYSSPGYGSPGYGGAGGYGDYGSPYYPYDPLSGFLQGAAGVMNADGKFRISNQQSNLLREQVRSAHIDNQRKAFDEILYERANRPTWLDDLERQRKLNLRYALTNPSGSEILGAGTLNTLLDNIKQMPGEGPTVALREDLLSKINVTAGGGVNPGLLKNERLTWPLALTTTAFDQDRTNVERRRDTAIHQAENGKVEDGLLRDLQASIDQMTKDLDAQVGEIPPSQFILASNYLKQLNAAVRALSGPDATNYVNNKYAAKGKTVGELVKNMQGLQFAPATPGDEQAYRALYDALVSYYRKGQPSTRNE
jgi:hypothetical protein